MSPTPNLSVATSDSHHEKKRKSSSSSVTQNKRNRSDFHNRQTRHSSDPHVTPYRSHVSRPARLLSTNCPGYRFPSPGIIYVNPYNIGSGRFGYPGGFRTQSTLHLRGQGQETERYLNSIGVNPSTYRS
ncbi:hypothetical protein KSS87_012493 [Heliosperma pusillum]|nr:hypothetical protein KSS87_012493 [Heliosperma pusillum]